MRIQRIGVVFLVLAVPAFAQIVSYEGTSFPDDEGWERSDRPFLPDRWVDDGWFFLRAEIVSPGPPVIVEDDFYGRSIAEFSGAEAFFVEWVLETDGPESFADVAPAGFVASGWIGIYYHFTIARDQVLFRRDPYVPSVWVDIEPDVPHTYRLELYGDEWYAWFINGQVVDSGVPEGAYPTSDSRVKLGVRASSEATTTRWNYVRFGAIPLDGSGDYDSDEDVDGRDFYFFHECLTNERVGINGGPDNDAGPGCRFADMDQDDDVDLHDFALFQNAFGQPR